MINNIAFLIKRFPLFPIPGDGSYYFQFVHAEDMAELIVKALESSENAEVDAVGPDKTTFKEIIEHCSKTFNTTCIPVKRVPKKMINLLTSPLNW